MAYNSLVEYLESYTPNEVITKVLNNLADEDYLGKLKVDTHLVNSIISNARALEKLNK